MMKRFLSFFFMLLFALSSYVPAVQIKAVSVEKGPKTDGSLSDPVWQSAVAFTAFRMVEPQSNQDPTEKTYLKILYDDSNLYIGVLCYNSEPGRIAATSMAHDSGGSEHRRGPGRGPRSPSDDVVRVLLDPFQDK